MQNSFHCREIATAFVVLACFCHSTPILAESAANEHFADKLSELHLLAAANPQQDIYHAAIDIILKPGALTYWRQPGDAGVPPVFSFEGSSNLAKAEVLYPAPTRIREDEGEAFGYRDEVIFPLHVTPRDKSQPVTLKLTADYAVCERICVPAKSRTEIILPSAASPSQAATVVAAEARVPHLLSKTETAEKLTLEMEKNAAHPSWRLNWKDVAPVTDLFAEAPEGWYFETKKAARANEFTIVAVEMPKTKTGTSVPVTLTLTGAHQSFEFKLPLDIASAAP